MLENAKKHEEKLKQLFFDTDFDLHYQFSSFACYREIFKIPDDTWTSNHFVSMHNNEIIGYIKYQIRRPEQSADGLSIIHFGGKDTVNNYIFGKDVFTAIRDIFEKYHFNKLNFSVVIGNPIESTYDKIINSYNGRIVGFRKQDVKLIDGKIYDTKEYEILATDYFKARYD